MCEKLLYLCSSSLGKNAVMNAFRNLFLWSLGFFHFKGRVSLSSQMHPNQSYNFGGIILAGGIERWWISYLKTPQSWVEVTLKNWMCTGSPITSWFKIRLLYIKGACAKYGSITVCGTFCLCALQQLADVLWVNVALQLSLTEAGSG